MRPTSFNPSALRQHLRRNKIADLPELKRVLGTDTDLTVFRKLKQLQYLASYTHRGRFYTLADIVRFDDRGLWSHEGVCFSRYGTLLATLETFVHQFLYTDIESVPRRKQLLARRSAHAVPVAVHSADLQASPDELKAAILLFYGLLDEQQRRLFAGLESIRLGHGGDTLLGDFLGLDVHTVARGRQQLLDQNVVSGRSRRTGGGRTPAEKKRPT
jgi:hypothetical protein